MSIPGTHLRPLVTPLKRREVRGEEMERAG